MNRWIGRWIMAVGASHCAFGLVVFRTTLQLLWSEGLINTVNGQPDRERAFWFLAFGLLAILLGALVDWLESQLQQLPAFLGWSLLALTAVFLVIMPISGGWLLVPPVVGSLRRRYARPRSR